MHVDEEVVYQVKELIMFSLASPSLAEKFLESVEGNQNYPILLLTVLEKSQEDVIRVCSAVTFKNYIKRNWRVVSILVTITTAVWCVMIGGCLMWMCECSLQVEDEPNKISDPDRTAIKANIVNLMLTSPEQIQKQVPISDNLRVLLYLHTSAVILLLSGISLQHWL